MRTVIILGTGATIGSGYTKCEKRLPGDRNFFKNQVVKDRIPGYPALDILLDFFRKERGKTLSGVGLEEVWTFLEYCSKGVYEGIYNFEEEKKEWLRRILESKQDDEHWYCKKFRQDRTIPTPYEKIDLLLYAGIDLRGLLNEIYGGMSPSSDNMYQKLLTNYIIPSDNTTTFISLNYDMVLEHALDQVNTPDHSSWFYAHVQTGVPRDRKGIRVLKPHGSLNWLFEGNEPSVSISTNYQLDPVQNRYPEINSFKEAMIIPPTQLKQVLNIQETQAKGTSALFTKIWKSMANVLAEANRVFIIGYSFPSTDHHFRTLMRQVNRQRKYQKYEKIFCCAMADGTEGETFANANRFFPSDCFRPYDQGFEAFVLQPSA